MARYEFVSPTDERRGAARRVAPRLASLDGARVALLDNRKGNANVLLERVGERLVAEHGAARLEREEKPIFSRPATPEQLDRLARTCDAVVTAIGD